MVKVQRPQRFLRLAGMTVALFGWLPTRTHPLHSTLTEITVEADGRTVTVTLRGFADDLALGTSRHAGVSMATVTGAHGDSLTAGYLRTALSIVDRSGHPILLTWSGTRRAADVLWFSFRASAPSGLYGLSVSNATLCEVHEDQVNIVQVIAGGKRRSLLFTPGAGTKNIF